MSGKIEIPASEMAKLRSTLQQYSKVSKKTEAQVCNDTALDWAFKALQQTEKANASEIAHVLGRLPILGPTFSRDRKTGQMKLTKGKSVVKNDSFSIRIVNTIRKKRGEALLFGKDAETAAKKFIAYRTRSVSFIKSGFLGSIQKLKSVVKGSGGASGVKAFGQPKGTAVIAKESLRPYADIINTANKNDPKAAAVANAGLLKALPLVIANRAQYIERKMSEAIAKIK